MFVQLLINGVVTGLIYSLVAIGFTLVYSTTRIFHIYYAALFIIAPYTFFTFSIVWGWNAVIAVILSLTITVTLSIIGELFVYQPFQKQHRSESAVLIASIGMMTILINLVALFWGTETKIINPGIPPVVTFLGATITLPQKIKLFTSAGFLVCFLILLRTTKIGTLFRAYRDDNLLFRTLGKNNRIFRIFAFAASGLIAGVAALLYAFDKGIEPYNGIPLFLISVTAMIIGGVGRYETPILGGLILGILQALVIGYISAQWQNAIVFAVLLLFLLLRPQGILGEKERLV